jgi:autotransporter adhesin
MPVDFQLNSTDRSGNRKEFVRNWVAGAGDSRSVRRRLMAILRLAHMALGMGRKRLGVGSLGVGASFAAALEALGIGNPTSMAQSQLARADVPICPGCGRPIAMATAAQRQIAQRREQVGFLSGRGALAAVILGALAAGTVAPGDVWAMSVSMDGNPCLSAANDVMFRKNPGGTNGPGMTAGGVRDGSGSGTYGWVSGCASTGTGLGYTAIGSFATATGTGVTAVGNSAIATGRFATAVGVEASATGEGSSAYGVGSIASGNNTVAIGGGGASVLSEADSTRATANGAIAIGVNGTRGAQATSVNGIAIGGEATAAGEGASAVGLASTASDNFSTAIGNQSNAQGIASTALGSGANTGADGATAVGNNASAQGVSSFAGGRNALAQGENSIAIGGDETDGASAAGARSIAMGTNSSAVTDGAIAIGQDSTAQGGQAVAIGVGQTATGDGAVAIGDPNVVNGTGAVAIGANNRATGTSVVNPATGAVAIGNANTAIGDSSVALGNNSYAGQGANPGVAIGENTRAEWGVAIGEGATTTDSQFGISIGRNTSAGLRGIAMGFGTTSTGDGAVAIGGVGTSASAAGGVALGEGSNANRAGLNGGTELFSGTAVASTRGAVSVGSGGNERQITNVAGGTQATDAVNVRQLQSVADDVAAVDDRAVKYDGALGDPKDTITLEGTAGTTITNVAPGELSATSTDAVNGSQLFATNEQVDQNTTDITNLGDTITNIAGDTSTTYVEANGSGIRYVRTNETGLTPSDSSAQGQGSTAVGYEATAVGVNALALGNGAQANEEGSVALGEGSVTAAAVGTAGATINGTAYTFAGTTPGSTVSIGSVGAERTITNVAAGQVTGTSTDAINGSQLFATNQAIDAIGTDVAEVGDRAVKYDGAVGDPKDTITLEGTAGTTITNVAPGELSATSTDAVNGSQLFATNEQVDQNTTDITNLGDTITNIAGDTSTTYVEANGSGIRYVRTNETGLTPSDSSAQGQGSTAVGYDATAVGVGALALGQNAIATEDSSVALGADSVTAAAVGTSGATINGTAYTFAGTNPGSTVSVGAVGAERTITNVAAGQVSGTSTDAINGSQLFATNQAIENLSTDVEASATHYFSVNSTETATGSNYDNDGATGENAVAVGVNASASGVTSYAAGFGATATNENSVALGTMANSSGLDSTAIGTSASASEEKAIAIGYGSSASETFAIALGSEAAASGVDSIAIGRGAEATGSVAMGAVARAGNGGTAVGDGAIATYLGGTPTPGTVAGTALGQNASADVSGGTAIGTGAIASNESDVALGAGSVTGTAIGTAGATINGTAYTFAGATPISTVSVGDVGAERTITNVAAGQVAATSTDAVNGSQLFATNQAIEDLGSTVEASATHYYSVNDGGTAGGNYNNDGATGTNAIAAGVGSVAEAANSVVIGSSGSVSGASSINSISVGYSNQIADSPNSIAIGVANISSDSESTGILGGDNSLTSTTESSVIGISNTLADVGGTGVMGGNNTLTSVSSSVLAGSQNTIASSTAVAVIGGLNNIQNSISASVIGIGNTLNAGNFASVTGVNNTATGTMQANISGVGNTITGGSQNSIVGSQNTLANGTRNSVSGFANTLGTGLSNTQVLASGGTVADGVSGGVLIGAAGTVSYNDGVAIGTGATATNEADVALGSGSVTDAAVGTASVDINGTTYTFAGTTPASTVSIGNAGAERTITNVAAGRISATSTDAINGSQLFATNQAVEAIDDDVAELGDRAVKYDGALADPKDTITLEGTAGTTITNLADGDISATSTDAVNGSQLFATNQQVDQNTTDITNLGDTITNIAGDTSTTYTEANGVGIRYARTNETGLAQTDAFAQGVGSTAVGYQATASAESALALGRDAQADVLGGVALGAGSIADRAIAPSTGTIPAGSAVITYNTTDQELLGAVSVGRDGAYRQITNVADGTDAQDAVTIRQLQGAIASVGVTATQYFHANSAAPDSLAIGTDSIAVGPSTVVNGDNGIGMGNGSIVDATAPGGTAIGQDAHVMMADGIALGTSSQAGGEQAIAIGAGAVADHYLGVALGSGSMTAAAVGTSEIVINGQTYAFAGATPESVVSIGAIGAERQLINVAAGRVTADSTDAINGSQLFATNQAVEAIDDNVAELDDRAVKYDGALGDPKDTITLEGTNGTTITNLAAGAVNATSTDAINGSQLYGVSNSIANHLGGGATVNPDGTVNGPTYVMQGGNYTTVYDTFAAVDTSLTNINNTITDINNGGGIKYFHANSAAADSQAIGQESVAVGPQAVANADNSVAMGNGATTVAGADGAVALGQGATANNAGDVALGSGSTTQAVVNTSGTTINGTDYAFAGTNATSTVSVGGVGSERTITNVAAGRVTADSTDAINGSQLYATNQAIDDLASGIGDLQDGAVMYDKNPDGSRANSVTLIGGDPNAPVLLSNVADGVANNDAVNVGQLKEGLSNTLIDANSYTDNRVSYAIDTANSYTDQVAVTTLNQANNYTDYKFGQLNQEIGEVRNEARQAAAIGLAAASLRYDDRPGKASVAVGGGVWRGQGAFALGAGYTSEDGRVRANLSATTAGGKWGAGAGISFTLN